MDDLQDLVVGALLGLLAVLGFTYFLPHLRSLLFEKSDLDLEGALFLTKLLKSYKNCQGVCCDNRTDINEKVVSP